MAMRRALRSTSFLKSPLRLTSFSTQSNHTNTSNYLLTTRSLAQTKTLTSFSTPFVSQCLTYVTSSPRVVGVEEKLSGYDRVGRGKYAELDDKPSIPVKAFLFSTSVDLKSLVEQNKSNLIPSTSRMTNYVVFKFGEGKSGSAGHTANLRESECECTYMVVYQYGSVVLFNAPNQKIDEYLKVVRNHASGWLPEVRKDEYEVKEKPSLDTWMQGGLDHIILQHLDVDGIRTIGSVLGQSIALDYYIRQVDGMVAEFTDINREMENSGTFTVRRKKLFQIVGRANSNLADVILKLGLFERSDIAWKDAKYGEIWEYLRDEFELTPRLASLDFKLKFVEHNIHFLQEILQNRRSDFLEWVIIILISVEILISLHDKFFPTTM